MHPSQLNPPGTPTDSDLDEAVQRLGPRAWCPKMVAGDLRAARSVNAGTASASSPVDYVAWLGLKKPNFNPDDLDHRRSVADHHGDAPASSSR